MTAPHNPGSPQFGQPSPSPQGLPTGQQPHGATSNAGANQQYTQVAAPTGGPAAALPPERPAAGGAYAQQRSDEDLGQPLSNLGDIVSNITEDLSTLVRQETELAKAEIKQSATRAGKGAGMFGGAGFMGWFAFLFLSIGLWWGIAHLIESFGWAAVIVGVLYAIIAGVLAMMGKKEFNKIKGLQRTTETASKIPNALKGNETTNG